MQKTYRFARTISYIVVLLVVCTGCGPSTPVKPANVFVGARVPASWPAPRAVARDAPAAVEAMRFSSLFVPLGSDWSGDFVATTNTQSVELFTNLYAFAVPKTSAGHFHFAVHLFDVPAFLVRPYALHVIARNATGQQTDITVPFEIGGRP